MEPEVACVKAVRCYRSALTLVYAVLLAACATSSQVLVGTARPPIDPQEVMVLAQAPEKFEEIAEVEASSGASLRSGQEKLDLAIEALKKEAARVGANDLGLDRSARLAVSVRGLAIYVPE